MKQLFGSSGLENMRRNSSAATSFSMLFDVRGERRAQRGVVVLGARELEQLARVVRGRCRCASSVPTIASSAFFSLPSSWARFWSLQTFGSLSALLDFGQPLLLAFEVKDTSAAPPTGRQVREQGVDLVDAFGFH